ncbi:MAG: class I SAM-dependent methyltransferase [Chloroflexi bacterium]|nr:class I SAM-dependent methyltransferase [Chloroflexota bacterium]
MESSYIGKHAEYYNIFYQDKAYAQEAAFVHACLQRFGDGATTRVLELACGTGRHAFELEKLDYELIATDYSPDMLASATQSAEASGSRVEFRQADMRDFAIPEAPFDAVVCLFDSIGYVQTNEAIADVLANVHKHLRPGGLFVFEFWHAAAMLNGFDPLRVKRWPIDGGELLRISETELEPDKQLAYVTYTIYDLQDSGSYTQLSETQTNRYFLKGEMQHWLETADLQPLAWFNGFQDDENIDQDTWHIVAVARRGE